MSKYPIELLQLERRAFAITKATPEMKAAHDKYIGAELLATLQEIGDRYGLNTVA